MILFRVCLVLLIMAIPRGTNAQLPSKEINTQFQTWVSMNSQFTVSSKWSLLGDVHIRRTDGIRYVSFYFARIGAMYRITDHMSVAGGYAHLWAPPSNKDLQAWAQENRIYQQFNYTGKSGRTQILHRIRNEQRWQKIPVSDALPPRTRFTNRVRYLLSFNIPVFKNPKLPMLSVSDELLVHFGKDVVYNTFDQNRLFVGIRQQINTNLSFDFGYMNVYQQRYSGYQYDMNHTLRLFFYYTGKHRVRVEGEE